MKAAGNPKDMVAALECILATLEMGWGEGRTAFQQESCYPSHQNPGATQRAPEEPAPQPSPRDEPMPTESEHHHTIRPLKPWLAGRTLHTNHKPRGLAITFRLNSVSVPVLLDSGSTITQAHPLALTRSSLPYGKLAITCIHGDVREVPTAEVQLSG